VSSGLMTAALETGFSLVYYMTVDKEVRA